MTDVTCLVAECDSPPLPRRAGYCYSHYMKNYRYGTPTPVHPRRGEDLTGRTFGLLTVTGERDGQRWLCTCECGATVRAAASNLRLGQRQCNSRHHLRSDIAEYGAAHERIGRERGPAATHACVDCGKQAQHWSYDHQDPHERVSASPLTAGLPYSLDVQHYQPRCIPCHKRFDLAWLTP